MDEQSRHRVRWRATTAAPQDETSPPVQSPRWSLLTQVWRAFRRRPIATILGVVLLIFVLGVIVWALLGEHTPGHHEWRATGKVAVPLAVAICLAVLKRVWLRKWMGGDDADDEG
jgi:peptidoglycan/LPS O-acetylase OafA/YrhL